MKIRVFTDGACSGNPGPGGWAAVILFPNDIVEICGKEQDTTNNRMELMAVIEAIKVATRVGFKVDIYSDSAYVVNSVKQDWLKKWSYNGWKTSQGEPVKNKDLWAQLINLLTKYKEVNLIKVKGHSGDFYNERVDKLARTMSHKALAEG